MAYGHGKTDMWAICCWQLFATVLEQSKETFLRFASPE